jgi:hypothetical protein
MPTTQELLDGLDLPQRRALIAAWLAQNQAYAQARLERYRQQGRTDDVSRWQVWSDFSAHAQQEIVDGTLDLWLTHLGDPNFDPTRTDRPAKDSA